jgi:hypothetical protein
MSAAIWADLSMTKGMHLETKQKMIELKKKND